MGNSLGILVRVSKLIEVNSHYSNINEFRLFPLSIPSWTLLSQMDILLYFCSSQHSFDVIETNKLRTITDFTEKTRKTGLVNNIPGFNGVKVIVLKP